MEQKQAASEQFEETLQKLEMEQKELIDNMTYEHDQELEQARERVTELREQEKREQLEIINEREEAEKQAWRDYNEINDKNREVLALKIEDGLSAKADLTR